MNLEKTGYVKNPNTGRPVKIGSRNWHMLVNQGVLSNENYKDEKELYDLKPNDNPEDVIAEINKTLPVTEQAVRGRGGKYNNKLIRRKKPMDNLEKTVHLVSKLATNAVKDMPELTEDNVEDWEAYLENMIMNEMVKPAEKLTISKINRGGRIYQKNKSDNRVEGNEEQYVEEDPDDNDNDNDNDTSDESDY